MPGQYLVSPRHRVASDDGPGVGGISAGQGGLPGRGFQFHSRILERGRKLRGQGGGHQFGPVGQHFDGRRVIRRQDVPAHRHPDRAGRVLRSVRSHQHHLAHQLHAVRTAQSLLERNRIDHPGRFLPVILAGKRGHGHDQIGAAYRLLDRQRRGAILQGMLHTDAHRHRVPQHQGHIRHRHTGGPADRHCSAINHQFHVS